MADPPRTIHPSQAISSSNPQTSNDAQCTITLEEPQHAPIKSRRRRAREFHRFSELPTELRVMIWDYCLTHRRRLRLTFPSLRTPTHPSRLPSTAEEWGKARWELKNYTRRGRRNNVALCFVNRESRERALRRCMLVHPTRRLRGPGMLFDPTTDVVYIDAGYPFEHFQGLLYSLPEAFLTSVTRLVLDFHDLEDWWATLISYDISPDILMPNLNQLNVVVRVESPHRKGRHTMRYIKLRRTTAEEQIEEENEEPEHVNLDEADRRDLIVDSAIDMFKENIHFHARTVMMFARPFRIVTVD
ncbi:hypothetical protein PVAG01_10650 [Phlyctema vagabunda]|uniref:2EXR domain-containing protein n=1 Tax=Phlyctema vagabunda TaxID=108571 RepID=A0ABR4P2W1_9HELO